MPSPVIQQCPACGRIVQFSHPDTTLLQCTCNTVIDRKEGDVLLSKPFHLVLNSGDLLQPGTEGRWKEQPFRVLGRFRTWSETSVFNYWTILFGTGELAYLGEGYGLYAIMQKTIIDRVLRASYVGGMQVDQNYDLLNVQRFLLEKRTQCYKWEIEGEVWMPERNSDFTICDLGAKNGRRITLFQFLPDLIVPFEVDFTSYASLQLTNTRLTGIPAESLTCESCATRIEIKTVPYAQSFACPACGSYYQRKKEGFRSTQKFPLDTGPDIPLGSRGVIKDVHYEVIGYALKEENNQYHAQWKEYTLYNRQEGYAFLSEYQGHWVYVREQGSAPVLRQDEAKLFVYEQKEFRLYNAYSFTVRNARGEFSNNLLQSEASYCKEFIFPPEMWIREQGKADGISWYHGAHISGKEIEKAFAMSGGVPEKTGIGAIEPRFLTSPYRLVQWGGVALLFLVAVHLLVSAFHDHRVILDRNFRFNDGNAANNTGPSLVFVSQPFHLDKWRSNLAIDVSAPVDNDWFELTATLVNKRTGAENTLEKGVEYYHGYSEGESWAEGSTTEDAYFTQIPSGDYVLQLEGQRSMGYSHVDGFHVRVTYDVDMLRNLFISMLLLLIWPVVQLILSYQSEKKRWYNSPYTPYTYEN